MDIISKCCG